MIHRYLCRRFSQGAKLDTNSKLRTVISYKGIKPASKINFSNDLSTPLIQKIRTPFTMSNLLNEKITSFKGFILPNGYPNTTKSKYLSYFAHITTSATLTSFMNCLTNQALFVVLGNMSTGMAFVSSAALTWVLKDGIGYFAGVALAKRFGEWLSEDIKKWRLLGLAFFGVGYLLELLTFPFPTHFLLLAGIANSVKSVCYMALSGSCTYINFHFAAANNIADVAGKCSTQGMLGTTLGYVLGLGVSLIINITSLKVLVPIIACGTALNFAIATISLRNIEIPYLNYHKLDLVTDHYIKSDQILSPQSMLKEELTWGMISTSRNIIVGSKQVQNTVKDLSQPQITEILNLFGQEKFICVPSKEGKLQICYTKDVSKQEVIVGYLLAAKIQENMKKGFSLCVAANYVLQEYSKSKREQFIDQLHAVGWKTDHVYVPFDKYTYESVQTYASN
eukprot:TRINITY_DN173_c0_g4_i1.p1 TRINITY_DN173_c0_g4~~TRINITY_DN173_c0_g4_i1.p1  ORF type:complete len:450 (-),score=90.69 TRINITY_DN173_c0_g4_i1:122-1471(-)